MGRFGYDIRVTHADDAGVHDNVVHIARRMFEDFWREHRDDLHREYEYQVDVNRTEGGTTITAWFSDWSGTRNLSAAFAVHLLRRFVHARRGKLSALIAVEGASCELEAPDDNEVFVVKQRWAKREGDRLVFDDGETAPAPSQETPCECWGCTSEFPDPRRQYVEVVRRSRIELLEKLRLMYLSPEATPEPEDDEISSDRVEVLRNFLPTRERELWDFFQARMASHPFLLACVLGDFFSLFRAGADDKRLGRGLDLWFACLTHTDEQVRRTTFATTGYITAFRFDKREHNWATGETISRFRELCERADFASTEELESTGAVILRTVRKEAYESGAGLLLWARQHEEERFRAAAKAWSKDIDPALVALADELQAADADLAIEYQPAAPSLADAYALINAHLAETELEGRSTRQTKAYKKAKKKAAEVVVACQLLGQTLGTATVGERSDETLVAARRRVEVFALRDALSKLKKTMLTHADLVTILEDEPTAAIWSAEFVALTERSLEGHGYDDEILSLIRTSLGRSEMDRSVEPEVRALLVGAISDDMMVWGLYPGEAEFTDRALTTLGQMEPEKAARWRAWLQHLSKWTTQSGAKYERWCEKNSAIVGELGDEEVMKTIAAWFDPEATPGRRPRTTMKDEAAHLLGGLFWTVLESRHPASDATLGVAFHMCFGPCEKYWRRLASELRRRDTLAAYLVYFKTARPALLASRILESSVWSWEAKVELLAAALTATSGSEAPEETIDEITTLFIKQMPDNFSQPFDQIRHHVCNAPARVPETLFRDHATRLIAACRPESIKDLRKVLQLRADARLHLEHADVVRLALFGVLYVPAKERMDWVIDEELDPFVPEICRVELPEEFAKDPSQFTSMALAFSSRLITRRKLHVAVEFLEIALSVREHADLYYNLACTWTLLSDIDAGFEAMARSVAMDPSNKRYALTDDELSTLRADPRFASL